MIELKVHDESFLVLTKEGYAVEKEGSPEAKLWAVLTAEEGKTAAELTVCIIVAVCKD